MTTTFSRAEGHAAEAWLSPAAREALFRHAVRYPGRELCLTLDRNGGGLFEHATLLAIGSDRRTFVPMHRLRDGALLLHTHVDGGLMPSEGDLEVARELSRQRPHAGFGIVSLTGDALALVLEPRVPPRVRVWHLVVGTKTLSLAWGPR